MPEPFTLDEESVVRSNVIPYQGDWVTPRIWATLDAVRERGARAEDFIRRHFLSDSGVDAEAFIKWLREGGEEPLDDRGRELASANEELTRLEAAFGLAEINIEQYREAIDEYKELLATANAEVARLNADNNNRLALENAAAKVPATKTRRGPPCCPKCGGILRSRGQRCDFCVEADAAQAVAERILATDAEMDKKT